ncbi:MAG: MarR family winged helix-turn-helix transcriptional regulator [Candidatus Hodarchaeota archaeon]
MENIDSAVEVISFSEIFELINRINKKYKKLQRRVVKESNLTPSQYSILKELWDSDEKPFKMLALARCCSQSTITGIIDTMEKNKLVMRVANPNDRRSLLVKLTDKGKNLKSLPQPIVLVVKDCCDGFEAEEVKKLTQLLRKLDNSFELDESDICQV